jgi:hypothetical protein
LDINQKYSEIIVALNMPTFFSTANILHIKDQPGSRLSADTMYSIYRAQLHGTAEDPSETNVAMKVGGPFLRVGGLALSCPPKKWGKLSQKTKNP